MRTSTLLTAAALAVSSLALFAACDEGEGEDKTRDDYPVYVNGVDIPANKTTTQGRMTVHEICTHDSIGLIDSELSLFRFSYTTAGVDGFFQLDTVNDRLVMQAGNISGIEGGNPFLEADNKWLLTTLNVEGWPADTIGYLPTPQRVAIIDTLTVLFADGREKNIDAILDIFQTAFVFYPCTAEEYKELEAKGLN